MSATIYSNKFEAFTVGDFPWGWVQAPTTTLTVQLGAANLNSLRVATAGWGSAYLPTDSFQHYNIQIEARCKGNRAILTPRWGGTFQVGGTIGLPADCLFFALIPNTTNECILGYYNSGGGFTSLGVTTVAADNTDYKMKIICNGTNIKCYVDDVLIFNVTSSLATKGGACLTNFGTTNYTNIKFSDPNKSDPLGLG